MKKTMYFLLAILFIATGIKAQDIITLTNGTQIQSKVLDITPGEVKYKDFNNPDGPTNSILKSTVASIQYANGVRTLFNEATGDKPRSGNFVRGNRTDEYKSSGNKEYVRKPGHKGGLNAWYFGVNIDLGVSNVSTSDPTYSSSANTYSAVNFLATYMFNPHVGIQFGLGDEVYNYDVDYNANSGNPGSYTYSLTYFTIPVRAVYFSNSKESVGFYAMAGLDFSVLGVARDNFQNNLSTYYSPSLVSPFISCGVEFRNRNDRVVWMIGPFYRTSLNNIYSADATNYLTAGNSGTINSVGISLSTMRKYGRSRR